MEFITIQEVEKLAKPGDKLQGILYQYPDGQPQKLILIHGVELCLIILFSNFQKMRRYL